jgi:hypothetical protein
MPMITESNAVDGHRLPNQAGIGAETPLPARWLMTGDGRSAVLVVGPGQRTAEARAHTERLEVVAGHELAGERLRAGPQSAPHADRIGMRLERRQLDELL